MAQPSTPPLPLHAFKVMVEKAVDVVGVLDQTGNVMYMSPSFEFHLGYTPDSVVGMSVFDLLHPDDRALALLAFSRVMSDEDQNEIVVRISHRAGGWRTIEVMGRYDANMGEPCIILNTRDITQRQALAEQIKRSEELFRAAFNATSAICSISRLDSGELIDVNDAWIEATGWHRDEAIGHTAVELNIWGNEENRIRVMTTLRERGRLRQFPARYQRKNGGWRSILVDAEILDSGTQPRVFLSVLDITDRELMEQQLRQSQRMEAVGQLTGGIAHDFNNLLTVILGQVDIGMNGELDRKVEATLTAIKQAAERGAGLIRQLMIFSRRQILHPEVTDVAQVLRDLNPLIVGSLGNEIDVLTDTGDVSWHSNIDRGLFENAVLNMAFNARDAMPQGGTLTLKLAQRELERIVAHQYEIPPGNYLELKIIDSGEGMDEQTIVRAFEPFFTTKEVGKGTGLGLSMVFGFVKQSGGFIDIDSRLGEGTTVTILLPATTAPEQDDELPDIVPANIEGCRILLVEDDVSLRTMLRMMLETLGAQVIESDGRDLLTVLEDSPELDLLLTDVVLKGPYQGPQIASLVESRYPGLAVLFMSGYARDRLTSKALLGEGAELIRKPFSRQELADRLGQVLAS